MAVDGRQRLGIAGEELAAEHLLRLGYRILDRNYRTRWGELDIVALGEGAIVFCEVKTRQMRGPGPEALDAVGTDKRRRVRNMARSWLSESRRRPYAPHLRFDAIGVTFDAGGRLLSLEHVEDAF